MSHYRTRSANIDISELFSSQNSIRNIKLEAYNNVINNLFKKLKIISKEYHTTQYIFEIPFFKYGILAKQDMIACSIYVIQTLQKSGFKVIPVNGNRRIFVSWEHYANMYANKVTPNEYIKEQRHITKNMETEFKKLNESIINQTDPKKKVKTAVSKKRMEDKMKSKYDYLLDF